MNLLKISFVIFIILHLAGNVDAQKEISVPIKLYPGYNFRTALNLEGTEVSETDKFVFNKQKYTQYKIYRYPLEKFSEVRYTINKNGEFESISDFTLYIFSGIDATGDLNVIADLDFNKNFLTDSTLVYKRREYTSEVLLESDLDKSPFLKLILLNTSYQKTISYFQPRPYKFYQKGITNYSSTDENCTSISISNFQYYQGSFSFRNKNYTVKAFTNRALLQFTTQPENFDVYITASDLKNIDSQYAALAPMHVGDTFELQNRLFVFKYNSNVRTFLFTDIGKPDTFGVTVGRIAQNLEGSSLGNNQFSLQSLRGNYVLLEFGFVACIPCIAATPRLNEISKKYSPHQLSIVSVIGAPNKNSFLDFVNKHTIQNAINVMDQNWRRKEGYANLYKIGYFPTYIIIDRNGKICKREFGLDGLANIEEYLEKIW